MLAFSDKVCYYIEAVSEQHNIRVWRSLVSRLNGVQEASSSNLDTRTKETLTFERKSVFFLFLITISVGYVPFV